MKQSIYVTSLVLCFAGGWVASQTLGAAQAAEAEQERPAYMIISVNEIHPEKMGPYKQAVGPVAREIAGGIELLAVSDEQSVRVMEGSWDLPGLLLIERYKSMEDLEKFWYSDEYQEVRKLREGFAEANFFVAIEGRAGPQ